MIFINLLQCYTISAYNKIIIEVGEDKKEFKLPDTKGLNSLERVKLGSFNIKGGTSVLTVKGLKEGWQECYMGSIELIPQKPSVK